jgi:hypothetical protein
VQTDLELEYLDDGEFVMAFENLEFSPSRFRHRDHVRTAWVYVTRFDRDDAEARVSSGIRRLATSAGAAGKYHETLTRGWVRAVAHFASRAPAETFQEFIEAWPQLLRQDLLLAHYEAPTLSGDEARSTWVPPDKTPIP